MKTPFDVELSQICRIFLICSFTFITSLFEVKKQEINYFDDETAAYLSPANSGVETDLT